MYKLLVREKVVQGKGKVFMSTLGLKPGLLALKERFYHGATVIGEWPVTLSLGSRFA